MKLTMPILYLIVFSQLATISLVAQDDFLPAGSHRIAWKGDDGNGQKLAPDSSGRES